MILLDTSGVLAAADRGEIAHEAAAAALRQASPPRLLSPFVLAELDYLVSRRLTPPAQHALLADVARGTYRLEPFDGADVGEARDVMRRYEDLAISLADASIVVLARRQGANDVLTLDERHFRVLRGAGDRPFKLLPADV